MGAMTESIKISVVIPAYNAEATIVEAIQSVFAQTASKHIVEIIIVDDGSTDGTVSVIKNFIEIECISIIKLVVQENKGAAAARNTGMMAAKGNWIALLDSDDVWLPEKIEHQLSLLNQFPDADFIGTGSNYGTSIMFGKRVTDVIYKGDIKSFCLKYYPVTPSVLLRTSIINEIGGFDESMKYGEDGEFFSRVLCHYNCYYIALPLVECGHGKAAFGESGLSSHLSEMYMSNIEIINRLKEKKQISKAFYLFLRLWYALKHYRRIVKTRAKGK